MRPSTSVAIALFTPIAMWAQYNISTFAGGGLPVNISGTSATLESVSGVAADSSGNVYVSTGNEVVKWNASTGILSLVAGNGTYGFSGDGGPAANAQLSSPAGLAVDSAGNVYIADSGNSRIRKVSGGVITTVAGAGVGGSSADNIPATSAALSGASAIAVDSSGNLYITDETGNRIRKVSNGVITTVAGNGTQGYSGDGGPATSAELFYPLSIAVDSANNLYIADYENFRIRKVSNGIITTFAGNGTEGSSGDGGQAVNAEIFPYAVAVDGARNVYIADAAGGTIREVNGNGVINTVAGGGTSSADGVPATSAQLSLVRDLAADSAGDLFLVDYTDNRVRKVSGGIINTIVGGGSSLGDGGPATSAQLYFPYGLALDSAGNLYVADTGDDRVREVSHGTMSTAAGSGPIGAGQGGFAGDGGPATSALLSGPEGVTFDRSGNLYIADSGNFRVRKVSGGVINTVVGNGSAGYSGDGGPATNAGIEPFSVAVDSSGNLFISDATNNVVREVSNGIITTVAGTGTAGYSGDNGPAASAQLDEPAGIALDSSGNLYIADAVNGRVRKVSGGVITTVAGGGTIVGDGPALNVQLYPGALAFDSAGVLYITDITGRVRKLANGTVTTIAGTGVPGFSGDGGPALNAQLYDPLGVAVDASGNVYVSDFYNDRVRILTAAPNLTISKTHTGNFTQGQTGATFTVTVGNNGGQATSGTVTVSDTTPSGMTLTGMGGTGWNCTGGTCTRSDTLAGGSSYQPITVTVNISPSATGLLTNTATASGGGSATPSPAQDTISLVQVVTCSSLIFNSPVGGGPLSQSCVVSNPSVTLSSNAPWLSASLNGTSLLVTATPGNVVNPQGGNAYSGTVTLSSGGSTVATIGVVLNLANVVTFSPASNSVGSGAVASASISIVSSGPWAVASDSSWVTITSPTADSSGNFCSSGNGSVGYSVAANTAPTARTATLTLLSGCPTTGPTFAVGAFPISQAAQSSCNTTSVFPQGQQTSFSYSAAGTGSTDTNVLLNNACSAPVSQAAWITITGSSASSFTFRVAPYSGSGVQTGTIVVGSQSITVTQNPPTCTYSVATTQGFSAAFPASGGQGSITIGTAPGSCAWTASASNPAIITQLSPSSGTGTGAVTFTVPANTQNTPQSATILVQGVKYAITQAAKPIGATPSYICTVTPDTPRTMRAEGEAELMADVVVACSGISAGNVMGDVIVTLGGNTTVTNHTLTSDPSHATTDALMLNVDSANQTWVVGQNAYRGVTAGPRSIRFPSIPLAPETGSFSHMFHITNLRVDASRVAAASNGQSAAPQVMASVAIQPPLANPSAGAAFQYPAAPFLVGQVPSTTSGSVYHVTSSSSFLAGSLTGGGPGGSSFWPLTFNEQQAHAYLPALAPGQAPSTPGVQYVAESGFVNATAFGTETGYSNNGRWTSSNASMGTRLMATVANVPCSVNLYAPVAPTGGSGAQLVSADATGSGGFPVASAASIPPGGASVDGLKQLTLTPANGAASCTTTGSATITWEVTAALANSPSALTFDLYVNNPNSVSLSGVTFTGGLAPQVAVSAPGATAPVPRFNASGPPTALLSFFFVPTGGPTSGGAAALSLPAKVDYRGPGATSDPRGKLVPQTTSGSGQCSQTATATVTNNGSVAANAVSTVQGSGPLSGCFGPNAQASNQACTCNTSVPPGGVYQCSAVSTSCTPATYSGFASSDQGNSDPNNSDTAQPAAPIVTLSTAQSPATFAAGDASDTVTVRIMNTGDDAPPGSISITQTLPANSGLTLLSITPQAGSAGDPYSQYWVCSVQNATTGTCTYGNNPNLNPPQEYLLNSSKVPAGFTQFTMAFQTSASASSNVNDTLQLNTNIGGNQYGTTYTPVISVRTGTSTVRITGPAPGTLPQATVNVPYTLSGFTATGGSGSYTWSAIGLPAGLSMSSAGVISGTPTGAATANVTVTVADATNSGSTNSASYTLIVIVPVPLQFFPVTPCRVVDTRTATAPLGGPIMAGNSTRSFQLPLGACNIPATAQAYSLNVTAVPQAALGYLTIWPTGGSQPNVSTLNSYNGAVVANAAIVPAGNNGSVSVYVTDPTQVILDINGYFAPAATNGLTFYPLAPCRVADTRIGSGSFGAPAMSAGQIRNFPMPQSSCGIPSGALAYSLNMTVVPTHALQYLTTWPTGVSQPVVSTLNAYDGRVVANAAIVPAGASGGISVYVSDATNVIIDINGYFALPGSPGALNFYQTTPCRVADTRVGTGTYGGPIIPGGGSRSFNIPGANCGVPTTAKAFSLNVTVVPPAPLQYLTIWPAGASQPLVSTLNAFNGQVVANAALVPGGSGASAGSVSVYVSDTTQLILDINGYFAP